MEAKEYLKKICCCISDPHLHTDRWTVGRFTYCWFQLELTLFLQNQFLFLETVQMPCESRIKKQKNKIKMLSRKRNKSCFSSQFNNETAELRKWKLHVSLCFYKPRLIIVNSTIKIRQTLKNLTLKTFT